MTRTAATKAKAKAKAKSSASDIIKELHAGRTRVRDGDGFVGTILYVGPVASAKNPEEIYAGIAWDDSSRGKHDGSVISRTTNELVRHFSCPMGSGSFLRLTKVDLGVVLDAAVLKERYVTEDAPVVAPNNLLPHTARTAKGREKPIEFLGELKIRARQQLQDLNKISLRSMGIAKVVEDESETALQAYRHMTEIDLAGNLLSDWNTVLAIIRRFPKLENINLASNRIQDVIPKELRDNCHSPFSRIRVLNLNDCSIKSSRTFQWIAEVMPNITEMSIAYSDMSNIQAIFPLQGLERLKLLDCTACRFDSWETQVGMLSDLPNLQHLVLNDNPIPSVPIYTKGTDSRANFDSLISLQLAGTAISSWMDLQGLNSLNKLTSLRLRNKPLTSQMGTGEARSICIARIPNLGHLNGSLVSSKERLEAERTYVSNVARDLLFMKDTSTKEEIKKQEFLKQHPHFNTLMQQHKESMMHSTSITSGSNSEMLGGMYVLNVTIASMAASSCSMEPLRKRLPASMQVGRLKLMCAKAFGLDMDLQTLHFKCRKEDPFPSELDDDHHTLQYYGVSDGAEIFMNEVDLVSQESARMAKKHEHQKRMEQQEGEAKALQELQRKARSVIS